MWRGRQPVRFEDLPTGRFSRPIATSSSTRGPGALDVIGGNVDNSVAMKQVPITADGRLADAGGAIVDPNDPWFVVLAGRYEQ